MVRAFLVAALIVSGCTTTQAVDQTHSTEGGLRTDCIAYPGVETVDELDELASTSLEHPGFLGGDGAMSARLGDGRHLAVFGDTLRADSYPGGSFARNSLLIFNSDTVCVVTGPQGGAVVSDRGDGVGYWPMSLVVRTVGGMDEVVMMMQRVAMTASDDLGFVVLGTSAVRLLVPHGGVPLWVSTVDLGADDPARTRVTWGAAMWRASDEWIYVYGTNNPQRQGVFGWALRVARTTWRDLDNMQRWQYWDGENWVSESTDARVLIKAPGGVAQVLSVFDRDGRWFAVSTKDGDLGDEVVVWDAPAPIGPFTSNPASMQLPPDRLDGMFTYLAVAHPDLFAQAGSVVVSYSRGSSDWEKLAAQPLRYRPRFARIDLPG